MKRFIILLSMLAALTACAKTKGPEAVAKQAMDAIQKKDYPAYAATFNISEEDQLKLAALVGEKVTSAVEEKGGIKSYNIADAVIDGDKATIEVTINYNNGSVDTETMHFIQVDGVWKQNIEFK